MRRLLLFGALVTGVAAAGTSAVAVGRPAAPVATAPAPTPSAATQPNVAAEANWVLTAQLPDGAIAHYVDGVAVRPYQANFAAMGLARAAEVTGDPRYASAAWRWLGWYQAHEDAQGFVADYDVAAGSETSTGTMDSTDAYAGTFLLAVRRVWTTTSDRTALEGLHRGVAGALGAIEATQDVDGLTWAKPGWHVKYLMDQAETYAGLRAASELAAALGDAALAQRAASDAQSMSDGVGRLWNATTGAYDWAVHETGVHQRTNWSVLYPDSLQQMWPVAFGLVSGSRASALVSRFAAAQLAWDRPAGTALFDVGPRAVGYWPVAGWAFARARRTGRAAVAATSIGAAALTAGRAWPYATANAGQLIQLMSSDPAYLAG